MQVAVRATLVKSGGYFLVVAVCLFGAAGRIDWPAAWWFGVVQIGWFLLNLLILMRGSPGLLEERLRMQPGTEGWDLLAGPLAAILGPLSIFSVAGLDARLGWSGPLSAGVVWAALGVSLAGGLLYSWAMASNPFFSSLVRIQWERGHQVSSGGPYRLVRHPGYAGMIVWALGAPLALGSVAGLWAGGVTAGLYILRAGLEDRTLLAKLEGYPDYARRVRWRVVPLVW